MYSDENNSACVRVFAGCECVCARIFLKYYHGGSVRGSVLCVGIACEYVCVRGFNVVVLITVVEVQPKKDPDQSEHLKLYRKISTVSRAAPVSFTFGITL